MPAISVIVPVYNVEKYLEKCICSILKQSYCDFELILIDDGSSDNSLNICNSFAVSDNRIKVISQENHGVSVARNNGIAASVGEYITFVDSDDYIDENYLENLILNKTDFTCCGMRTIDESGKELKILIYNEISSSAPDYDFWYTAKGIFGPYCKLFSSSIIKENNLLFPVGVTWGEDGMFVADYLKFVKTWKYISYVGYNYVRYNIQNSLSTRIRPEIIDTISSSREYCLSVIGTIKPETNSFLNEEIIRNCADFVTRTFLSVSLTDDEKENLLIRFLDNYYVHLSIKCPEKYYQKDIAYILSHKKNNYIKAYNNLIKNNKRKKFIKKKYSYLKEILHLS